MEANAGLVAGSHKRNELVVIRPDNEGVSFFCFFPSFPRPSCFLSFFLHTQWHSGIGMEEGWISVRLTVSFFLSFVSALLPERERERVIQTKLCVPQNGLTEISVWVFLLSAAAAAKASESCEGPYLSNLWG
jgi:hypothetical protein